MPSFFEIQLKAEAQSLTVDLSGATYTLTVRWNNFASAWVVDIATSVGVPLLSGIPLVAGTDLLGQFPELDFGGILIAFSDGDLNLPPSYESLGLTSHLYFVTR